MTLPVELQKAEVVYSYKCELCNIREWHIKPSTKFHYNNVNKCSGIWVEEKWFNASFFETARKEHENQIQDLKERIEENLAKETNRLWMLAEKQKDAIERRTFRSCGLTLGINAKREVRKAFTAVLGEERKGDKN